MSGIIGMSNSDAGSYINIEGQNAKLATITALEPIYAEFSLKLRAKFQNKNRELVVGSYAELKIDGLSYAHVAKVPQNALVKTQDATIVYIIKDGAVSMRPIKSAHVQDGIAYVEEGVQEGEDIVISNIAKLKPNSKVTIMKGN
ncbi:hypothetical protein [Sulfurimonas sp.]|uniref:efflux RND transporter periplasmic adaptor subunit n=1 Tax=Sulfurimonas sp. TaxID=2022749 RepID=UPI0025F2721A|nr:hypothetical protein [Sulfurimonas sp.]